MSEIKVAIIGGTGVYTQKMIENEDEVTVKTGFGSVRLIKGQYKDKTIYFLARHGGGHSVPPHLVNYRANISALKRLKVDAVVATAAVGTLNSNMPPGSRVVIDQFIDFTKNRIRTFYEGQKGLVVHTDFTEPYCPDTRSAILKAGEHLNNKPIDGGCYVCAEGPRFETPAEIKMIQQWGGDLVGMTNIPEVVLAREAGLCYATIALATNYAAGISRDPLSHEEVLEAMEAGQDELEMLLRKTVEEIGFEKRCSCREAGLNWVEEVHG